MTMVIVGGGLAGAKAAQTLREEGYTGRVVLIGEEPERPYERPPLSKGLLLGSAERESVFVPLPDDVELWLGSKVATIDRERKLAALADGRSIGYDKLLLATGSRPRPLRLENVHYLRTLADSDLLADRLRPGTHLVVIGAGWIGLEVAAAARARDVRVTVIEMAYQPLQRVLGDEIGALFARLHRGHGVAFHLGTMASPELIASLQPDLIVAGAGIQPNVELALAAGLTVDNGIVTNAAMCTSDPDIFAAGDVANAYHPLLGRHVRVEHWANALNTGPAAARAMLGQEVRYELLPYFYTDQYELGMEYSGYAGPGDFDQIVVRGSVEAMEFLVFWASEGRVLAGMNVNVWDVQDDIQALVRAGLAGKPVDLDKLADPDVPLTSLISG